MRSEEDLLRRAEGIRGARLPRSYPTAEVKKVLVLSRVTLGADVAVTSVVLSRMKNPEAKKFLEKETPGKKKPGKTRKKRVKGRKVKKKAAAKSGS